MIEDDTLLESQVASSTTAALAPTGDLDRYEIGAMLGRGGMGEVRVARDTRMDREVAIKVMRDDVADPSVAARFVREARVQGALEHPAIVPVHDLGVDPDRRPYFIMKRLTGTTLADALAGDRETWPRRMLLGRLVDVALAIELAHTRGIVHRDLKPSNIMLGDFGEVYVLDWGLARRAGDSSLGRSSRPPSEGTQTQAGELLGTPGYMPPEQARGEPVGPAADVFSLGLVLYEIVAGVAALPRGIAALAATIEATHHRPSERTLDVPPELDDLCARATARDPAARPTARQLADGVQAYLDGDRDDTRRRALAAEHVMRARAALEQAGDAARAAAMREAGRAIALDAANADAQQLLARLLIDAPAAIPAEALAAADEERAIARQRVLRLGATGYVVLSLLALLLFVLPVRTPWPIATTVALALGMALLTWQVARRLQPMRTPWYLAMLAGNALLLAAAGLVFGPLLAMPILAVGSLGTYLSQPARYPPLLPVAMHALPLFAVLAAELLGIVPSTFATHDGQLTLRSWTLELTPNATAMIFSLVIGVQFAIMYVVHKWTRLGYEAAQDRLHAQRWHLMQLVR